MKDTKITNGNPLPDEVEVNLNMLGTLMLNWIGGHVDNTIVTINQCGAAKRSMKFLQELVQACNLSNSIGDCAILSFST